MYQLCIEYAQENDGVPKFLVFLVAGLAGAMTFAP